LMTGSLIEYEVQNVRVGAGRCVSYVYTFYNTRVNPSNSSG